MTRNGDSALLDLKTPAFLVDGNVVESNCRSMREKAIRSGVSFRPHVKTHKTIEIGKMQHGGAFGPVTVSTLAEAEFFADAGFDDITYAVPIAPEKLERAAHLARRIRTLNVLIDSDVALAAIERSGERFNVFLKVDCGYHRAGVDPDAPESIALARKMAGSGAVDFRGLLTHAGHSYNARNRQEVLPFARAESDAVTRMRAALDLPDLVRSIGSTPTASVVDRFENCDEVRPGNYVFFDAFQATIGSCAPDDVAVSVLTTVVGSYPERGSAIVDAGALALSKDAGPDHVDREFGFGLVRDSTRRRMPIRIVALSQEHGKLQGDAAVIASIPVGTLLRIIPNHSCLTAAMYPEYHVMSGDKLVDRWLPVRGW